MTDESPVATIGPALLLSVALSLDDIKAIERYASAIRADERGKARAELEALRKDAERYRWLRRRQVECAPHVAIAEKAADRFDAAIDAAMSTGATHEQ